MKLKGCSKIALIYNSRNTHWLVLHIAWFLLKKQVSFIKRFPGCFQDPISAQCVWIKRFVSREIRCYSSEMKINRQYQLSLNAKTSKVSARSNFKSNMVFPQVLAAFLALFDAIGLPGNLLVITILETRFHVIRYILLASLAVSDFLYLILVNSFRIASIA